MVGLGGLHIVGTERHESRRIDNQLRGRAGRQGDPGSSRFFLSLQDDLLRIFGGERMQNLMLRLGMEEDVPIESKLITKRIAAAQKAVEAQNFEARKHLLEYDDVMNKQRQAVYGMRRQLLEGVDQKDARPGDGAGHRRAVHRHALPRGQASRHLGPRRPAQRRAQPVRRQDRSRRNSAQSEPRRDRRTPSSSSLQQKYQEKEDLVGAGHHAPDRAHRHAAGDRQPVERPPAVDGPIEAGHRQPGYGQKDPLVEYKKESFELFKAMMDRIEDETVRYLFFLQVSTGAGPVLPFPDEDEDEEEEEERARARCRASSSAGGQDHAWRTSRATSSARRTGNGGAAVRRRRRQRRGRSRWSRAARSAATIPAPAAAARNTRSATGPEPGVLYRLALRRRLNS